MKYLLLILLLSACNNQCKSITDIYYYPPNVSYDFNKTEQCKYTLNILNKDIPTIRINRKFYNNYKEEYEKQYKMPYPFKSSANKPLNIPLGF